MWLPMISLAGFWGIPYLHQIRNFDRIQASLACTLMWLSFAVFAPFIGAVSNRIKLRKGTMVFLAIVGLLACTVIISSTQYGYLTWLVAMIIIGFSATGAPLSFSAANDIMPKSVCGTAIGIVNMAIVLGGFIGELSIGGILQYLSSLAHRHYFTLQDWHMAFKVLPLGFIIGLLVSIYFLKETKAQSMISDIQGEDL